MKIVGLTLNALCLQTGTAAAAAAAALQLTGGTVPAHGHWPFATAVGSCLIGVFFQLSASYSKTSLRQTLG